MIHIGFIQPSSDYLHDPFRGDPFTHLQILTVLENHFSSNVNLEFIDLRGVKKEFAVYHIPECDIYLYSVYTLDYKEQVEIVGVLKSLYPKAIHIAGGPHANTFPEESLNVFDALILGEGERTIIQAIKDFINGRLKKIYKEAGIININDYPHWQRKYMRSSAVAKSNLMTQKRKPESRKIIGTTVMFSRGCPYNCHFCAIIHARKDTPGIRYRTPELIEQEITYLKREYGIQGINLMDEIGIPLNKRTAVQHLEALGRSNVIWRGQCRVDGINPELAKLAKQSGCVALGLGVESVHQLSLDIINKKICTEQTVRTIRSIKEAGIEARLYMIMGLPAEPKDIVEKTWSFIQETQPDLVYLSIFTIRPGTEIYNHPDRFGIKSVSTEWEKTMHMHGRFGDETPLPTFEYHKETPWGEGMSPETIINNYLELQKRLKENNLCSL